MKNQALFSSKDKSKKLKCRLQQFLFGALRVFWQNAKFLLMLQHEALVTANRHGFSALNILYNILISILVLILCITP